VHALPGGQELIWGLAFVPSFNGNWNVWMFFFQTFGQLLGKDLGRARLTGIQDANGLVGRRESLDKRGKPTSRSSTRMTTAVVVETVGMCGY
jgi:hypothetical protein